MVYGFMPGPEQVNTQISIPKRQAIAGNAIGILVLDLWYPYLPGNVANASTFHFPVLYKILKGKTGKDLRSMGHDMLRVIIEGARELEEQGVRAIVGACGFFGNYQKETAAMLHVPVYLSSLLQIPLIKQGLKPKQKVGVITAITSGITSTILSQCGVDDSSYLVIAGAENLPEFRNILQSSGHFNSHRLGRELVKLAEELVKNNPNIGAILLECSDMPPYAWAIQDAVGLPVFDFTTLINWIYNAVVRRPFAGFY